MNEVFARTRELGEAILVSEEYQAMKRAEETAMRDESAAGAMAAYIEKRQSVQNLMIEKDADMDEIARLSSEVEAAQTAMQTNEAVMAMTRAREEFQTLIAQVNQTLRFIVTGEMNESACGGGCDSCAGCGNAS